MGSDEHRDGLRTLREALARVKDGEGRGVPATALVAAREALGARSVTIDLDAEAELGHPMVVVTREAATGDDAVFDDLSPREREVAELVAAGLRNRDIALALHISVATVKDHVHRILRKSGLDGRAQIAALWRG